MSAMVIYLVLLITYGAAIIVSGRVAERFGRSEERAELAHGLDMAMLRGDLLIFVRKDSGFEEADSAEDALR